MKYFAYSQYQIPATVTLLKSDSIYSTIVPDPALVQGFAPGLEVARNFLYEDTARFNAYNAIEMGKLGVVASMDATAPFMQGFGVARTLTYPKLNETTLVSLGSGHFSAAAVGNKTIIAPASELMTHYKQYPYSTMPRSATEPMAMERMLLSPMPQQHRGLHNALHQRMLHSFY